MQKQETIVISVGGSLIVPDQIDTNFLKRFNKLIRSHISKGRKFAVIAGGGKTARRYQDAARGISGLTSEDLDWLGIHACRLNAHLLRTIFRDIAHPVIVKNPQRKVAANKPLIVGTGWRPGRSSDYVSTLMAKNLGAKKLVNLTNTDGVFDRDPNKYKHAKHFKTLDWNSFKKLLPKKWDPGLSSPFDPVAAKEAARMGLEVAIMNGSDLKQLENYLNNKPFTGTTIA